jgi:hypothetical protein
MFGETRGVVLIDTLIVVSLSGDDRSVWGKYFEGINQFLGLWFFSAWDFNSDWDCKGNKRC